MKPETRRALRTSLHALGAVWMLGLLTYAVLNVDPSKLLVICLGLIAILFAREIFHGAENVTARIKFAAGASGVSGEVSPHDKPEAD